MASMMMNSFSFSFISVIYEENNNQTLKCIENARFYEAVKITSSRKLKLSLFHAILFSCAAGSFINVLASLKFRRFENRAAFFNMVCVFAGFVTYLCMIITDIFHIEGTFYMIHYVIGPMCSSAPLFISHNINVFLSRLGLTCFDMFFFGCTFLVSWSYLQSRVLITHARDIATLQRLEMLDWSHDREPVERAVTPPPTYDEAMALMSLPPISRNQEIDSDDEEETSM
ncbi:unnamed protein product [Caenorhabditis sp. 36 PRJEB53466]|nr:unnamed protein product [Caenorhabditis sp. 36 PRJEB53466]